MSHCKRSRTLQLQGIYLNCTNNETLTTMEILVWCHILQTSMHICFNAEEWGCSLRKWFNTLWQLSTSGQFISCACLCVHFRFAPPWRNLKTQLLSVFRGNSSFCFCATRVNYTLPLGAVCRFVFHQTLAVLCGVVCCNMPIKGKPALWVFQYSLCVEHFFLEASQHL